MINMRSKTCVIFLMLVATAIASAISSSTDDDGDTETLRTMSQRSIFKGAGNLIGKTMNKLPLTVQKFAHYMRARSLLKADAKFHRENRIYEKKGGIERANFDFRQMDVTNVEYYTSAVYGLVKKGTVGDGVTVRLLFSEGWDEPQIVLSKLDSTWQRTSAIHVIYKD